MTWTLIVHFKFSAFRRLIVNYNSSLAALADEDHLINLKLKQHKCSLNKKQGSGFMLSFRIIMIYCSRTGAGNIIFILISHVLSIVGLQHQTKRIWESTVDHFTLYKLKTDLSKVK
jgi:hypothetical protein